jgi:Type II secretion system (T2SS), protein M subtype b
MSPLLKLVQAIGSKIAALGILFAAVGAIAFAAYQLAGGSTGEDTQALQERYDRLRAIANFKGTIARQSPASVASFFLSEGPPAVLSANLQAKLRDIATERGVEILQASDIQETELRPGLNKLGVRVQLVGPLKGIVGVVEEIEKQRPWLFADNVEFHSGYADGIPAEVEPSVTLAADVWGLSNPVKPQGTAQ